MKMYSVVFTMNVYEDIEANSAKEAEDIFFEMWNSGDELIRDYGKIKAEYVGESE